MPAIDFRACTHARVHTCLFLLRWCQACTISTLAYTCNDAAIAGARVCNCPAPPRLHSFTSGHRPIWPPSTARSHRQELSSAAKMVKKRHFIAPALSLHRWRFLAPHAGSGLAQHNSAQLNSTQGSSSVSAGSAWQLRTQELRTQECSQAPHGCQGSSSVSAGAALGKQQLLRLELRHQGDALGMQPGDATWL